MASLFIAYCFRQTGEVFDGHCERLRLSDDLNRFSMQVAEGRAQCFMPPDQRSQRALERSDVERVAQAHSARRVVDRIAWLQLVNEPQTLLSKRERHHLAIAWRSLYWW